jgi:two-component system, NtrC family, response regulator GlrR
MPLSPRVPEVDSTFKEAATMNNVAKPEDNTLPFSTPNRASQAVEGFSLRAGENRVTVLDGVAQVGSAVGNTLVMFDPTVSRFHCEIRVEAGRIVVRDLGSTNGTSIDGVQVKEGYLKAGSILRLGSAEVQFQLEGKSHALPVSEASKFGDLVGTSAAMRQVFAVLEKAARTDSTLILEGETGTGKTRAAMALHFLSHRVKKPFLVVDCGALPPNLLEAELFGHEKGAFTGANQKRMGIFEEAEGGTVLLDEVGELPLELQPRLLRVLEERQIKRLGQNRFTSIDVRILAATHRDLRAEVNAGRFRSDLYFRLAVVRVTVPALRERLEDLPGIARAVLAQLKATQFSHPSLFDESFLASLRRSRWPGNVRELRNYLERCMLFEEHSAPDSDKHEQMTPGSQVLEPAQWNGLSLATARQRVVESFEQKYLQQLLERHDGKVSRAAQEADVDRVYLYRLIRKYQAGFTETQR